MKKVAALKPKDESISGFVRELIEKEHRVRENRAAALVYRQFLIDNPAESLAMDVWESAPLSTKSSQRNNEARHRSMGRSK